MAAVCPLPVMENSHDHEKVKVEIKESCSETLQSIDRAFQEYLFAGKEDMPALPSNHLHSSCVRMKRHDTICFFVHDIAAVQQAPSAPLLLRPTCLPSQHKSPASPLISESGNASEEQVRIEAQWTLPGEIPTHAPPESFLCRVYRLDKLPIQQLILLDVSRIPGKRQGIWSRKLRIPRYHIGQRLHTEAGRSLWDRMKQKKKKRGCRKRREIALLPS
mmetsp:Transcript_12989/g.25931  ORF Transcript_12989/g.25931 Transcript_12989/m.25931 type:complete len:218 (-) Transcript_12989:124-777(-)